MSEKTTNSQVEKKPSKLKDYMLFSKIRLSFSVVIAALSGYLFALGIEGKESSGLELLYLMLGGMLVTAASNGTNQIIEKDLDAQMNRTKNRPLPQKNMSVREGVIVVTLCLLIGTWMLYQLNLYAAILGLLAYVSYAFVYTPMKRISPWAVLVGAFPGAISPMLGAIAVTGEFGMLPGALFFVQFVWQFPHFWAIAWISHEDYQQGGFDLLPSKSGKSKASAFQIMFYALLLIPFSLFPWIIGFVESNITVVLIAVLGLIFFLYAFRLYRTTEDIDARKLMFASIIYLPLIQFTYVIDLYIK